MKKLLLLLSLSLAVTFSHAQSTGYVINNKTSDGAIGTAAGTVDVYSRININQTTPSITLSVPAPTNKTTKVTEPWIANIGTVPFTLELSAVDPGFVLDTGKAVILKWVGTKYVAVNSGTEADLTQFIKRDGSSAATTGDIKIGDNYGFSSTDGAKTILNSNVLSSEMHQMYYDNSSNGRFWGVNYRPQFYQVQGSQGGTIYYDHSMQANQYSYSANGGSASAVFDLSNLTTQRNYKYPDTSGTLALKSYVDSVAGTPLTVGAPLSLSVSNVLTIPAANGSTDGYLSASVYNNLAAAYTARIANFTTTGSSGAATFSGNTLNIPNYTIGGLAGSQSANTIYAGPSSGSAATPTFRSLVNMDLPPIVAVTTNVTPVIAGDRYQTVVDKLQSQADAVAYAKFSDATIQNWLANITANGGSVSPSQLGAGLYFLNGLNQIGILSNCVFANLCIGNNYQAAATNIIYQGANKYCTGTGRALGTSDFNPKKGWITGSGLTSVETNFNVSGYSSASLTCVSGISDNTNFTGGNIFGFSGHGILKTNDRYGFSFAQFAGRSAGVQVFEAMFNATGDHVLVQGSGSVSWYKDGLLYGSASDAGSSVLTSNTMKISASNVTYTMVFNIALNASQTQNLQAVLDGLNVLTGRGSNALNLKSTIFEGTSITSSYVPPFAEYSPKYTSSVLDAIGNIDVNNNLSAQLSLSGKTIVSMYNDAINNTRLLNTNNYNKKQNNVIVIEPGPNDMGNTPYPSADFLYDTYIVPMCRNRIAAGYTVILQTSLNSTSYTGYSAPGIANLNDASTGLRRLNYRIKSDPNNYNGVNAHGVVLFDEIPETLDPNNTTYYQDGLHPTALLGSTIWAPVTAAEIRRAIGRKVTDLGSYQSEIPQYITSDIAPAYNGTIRSYRQFKNFVMNGTFNFTLPNPMLFFGTKYNFTSTSGTQTLIGTVSGITNPTLLAGKSIELQAVRTGSNTFEWKFISLPSNGSTPTIAAGTGAGTAPTVSVTGTDLGGYITVTTGTTPSASSATIATVTFNTAYASAPRCIQITSANPAANALFGPTMPYVDRANTTTTTFVLSAGTSATPLTAATTYEFYYTVIQ